MSTPSTTSKPPDRLGPYEILAPLGAGGMGEVYRARDSRLNREVAIKMLPANFANDPARMARFQREAQVLAALNHPNIAALYGLESGGLVMELVDGVTLAERIAQGPIPLNEALAIAHQIGEALEASHEKNIIHRDLKPANVKVTPEGKVKVLDFGLAKAFEPDASTSGGDLTNSPTITLEATRTGVILGTAGYMSPEQARGKPADKRADIWSFGVVLFEMLSGRAMFEGETVSDTLAAVLRADLDWSRLPADTPSRVRRLLQRCLERDPKRRLRDIGDWLLEIDAPEEPGPAAPAAKSAGRLLPWALAALLAIAAAWGWLHTPPAAARPVARFSVPLPGRPSVIPLAVSRDGSRVAFPLGANRSTPIYMRAMDQLESKPIPGTEGGLFPSFSPDGQWIAYLQGNPAQLKKIPVSGGAPVTLADGFSSGFISWGEDDNILGDTSNGIVRVPASGGKPQLLATADAKNGESGYGAPQLLPGGRLLITIATRESNQVAVLNPKTGEKKILLDGTGFAYYAATGTSSGSGHIVYGLNGSLFAVQFDVDALKVSSPQPVLDGVMGVGPYSAFGISDSGTLVYFPGKTRLDASDPYALIWADRHGAEQPIAVPPNPYTGIRLSPDGGRLALTILDYRWMTIDVWTYDLARGTLTRLTFERANTDPVWTPDGKRLIFQTIDNVRHVAASELRSVSADGSGSPTTILPADGSQYRPTSVSPNGKLLMGVRTLAAPSAGGKAAAATGNEIWVLPLAGDSASGAKPKPRVFLQSPFTKASPVFSPDGKWVAYTSNETGRNEIYVVPYPGPGGKSQVSNEGGTAPRWAANGRELFYRNRGKTMAVDIETGARFRAGTPKMLFDKPGVYDVSPDGKRFLMTKQGGAQQDPPPEMHVVLNWFEELRRRAPAK